MNSVIASFIIGAAIGAILTSIIICLIADHTDDIDFKDF